MQFIKHAFPNQSNRTFVLQCLLCVTVCVTLVHSVTNTCFAVTSKITRHSTYDYFSQGETDDCIIDSKGTIKLGLSAETIVSDFTKIPIPDDYKPWSINSIVVSPRAIYIGTSPNGGIYKYSIGKLSKIYPIESEQESQEQQTESEENQDENSGSDDIEAKEHLTNEHIFAMALDVSGRLLAGISGKECKLLRFEKDEPVSIFEPEPNETKYIFAISVVENGNIYLGTGPEGKIYRLGPLGQKPTIVFESKDKNILSLAIGPDGYLYAGTDTRGLVYQINTDTESVKVLYDSEQAEVTALLFSQLQEKQYVYAAGTSAQIAKAETKFAASQPLAGRPEEPQSSESPTEKSKGGLNLKIPNTKSGASDKDDKAKKTPPKPPKPSEASFIYQIDQKGYVTNIFSEKAVIFAIAAQQEKLLVGTGNSGALFQIEPATEEKAVIYEDKKASQISAVTVAGQDIYAGTANPAKFIKLTGNFAYEGSYTSDLIDGSQPTRWGKLQIEADIPNECEVLMSCRSGNVKDVNDPTFSDWTRPVKVVGPVQMECPLGRFAQYKLILKSPDGKTSPVIREVVLANTIPNLSPVVESVSLERLSPDKKGLFKISYKARDGNDDKLIYNIDFRKAGRSNWIELEEKNEKDSFEWDGKTVEDGRYEIRVTASDERSNTPATALTGSRISDPVVVDNTGPAISSREKPHVGKKTILRLKVKDEYSAIDKVAYTVDSHAEWKSTVPLDLVFDTVEEDVDIVIEQLEAGEHVIAIKAVDVVGNTTYRSFEINLLN
ncbi:MAG: flagellar hook assembly protein FlgD [Planctomycetota bacterium]